MPEATKTVRRTGMAREIESGQLFSGLGAFEERSAAKVKLDFERDQDLGNDANESRSFSCAGS